jgi:hypothetical protein
MSDTRTIRPERSFETYSRGLPLVKAIHAMWEVHRKIPYTSTIDRTLEINTNIERLMADFDLTLDEWHYWADIAMKDMPQ